MLFCLILLLICCVSTICISNDDSYLAVCVIAKDEPDIAEWVEYHRRIGVTKFYVFDHNSSTPLLHNILQYARTGLIEYRILVGENIEPSPQHYVFEKCLREFGHLHTFMAFIDIDEFVVVKSNMLLTEVLHRFEPYGGVVLNWRIIGSSGHVQRPSGGVLKNYYKCGNDFHIKSIVQPKFTVGVDVLSHSFIYKEGYFAVDPPIRSMVYGPVNPAFDTPPPDDLFDLIYINHYAVKSLEDFQAKIARGRSDQINALPRDMALFQRNEEIADHDCEHLVMPIDRTEWSHVDL